MRKLFKFFKWIIILIILFIIGVYIYAYMSPTLDIKNANQFYIYDSNIDLIYQGSGNNEWVSLDDISQDVLNAIISTEDKNFYKHNGFDFFRICKALIVNISNKEIVQGASTISQQYVKNMYLDFDKTLKRKVDEALLTIRLELKYSKDEILEGYLNTINFGEGNYGIENASLYYFNKHASELSLEEACILAGIPKAPSKYNPISNYDNSIDRANIVSKLMLNNNYISQTEYNNINYDFVELYGSKNEDKLQMIMYYQDAVYNELSNIESIPGSLIESGGLKIYTSLNYDIQKQLEISILNNMTDNDMQVASIIIDPNTGGVMALSGGYDYSSSQFNRAINAKRQVGSSIKPLLYYSALENGMVSSSTFLSEPTTFVFSNNTYSPSNYNNKYANKNITMAAALAYSDNIYAIKTHLFLGEDNLVNIAHRMGIKEDLEEIPSLALGTCELSMIDFARAYTTLASGGYKRDIHFINKVEDMDGNVLYENKDLNNMVLNESYTYILNEMMTSTYNPAFIDYNTPTVMSIAGRIPDKFAIKTGSSGTDCWMVGYDSNILMMVWNGYDNNEELKVSDGAISKNIWADTINNIDIEYKWYEKPNNVIGIPLDAITGEETSDTSKINIFYYLSGSQYNSNDEEFVYKEKSSN